MILLWQGQQHQQRSKAHSTLNRRTLCTGIDGGHALPPAFHLQQLLFLRRQHSARLLVGPPRPRLKLEAFHGEELPRALSGLRFCLVRCRRARGIGVGSLEVMLGIGIGSIGTCTSRWHSFVHPPRLWLRPKPIVDGGVGCAERGGSL